MKVIVFGAGLVGKPMAVDLARDEELEVTVADMDKSALERVKEANPEIRTVELDLSDADGVRLLVADQDLVLSAVPGAIGYQTLRSVIQAGRDVVDIAFFPEDPFGLDSLAKERGVTAIVDCGVAPGMTNLLVGHADHLLDKTDTVEIYVGGLPRVREWPYEYKAGFSPMDVIEEYTRPVRLLEHGQVVVREALSEPERIQLPGIGTLEAFNTDGLRTLIETVAAPNMKEKTLRYPGHIDKMAVLRATGLFSKEEIELGGVRVRPIDFTARLLFPMWELEPGEVDLTIFRVTVAGERSSKPLRYVYDMLDQYDPNTETHSMARTTGYSATTALRMLAAGLYTHKGISPPELVGRSDDCVAFMLKGLADRGVVFRETVEEPRTH